MCTNQHVFCTPITPYVYRSIDIPRGWLFLGREIKGKSDAKHTLGQIDVKTRVQTMSNKPERPSYLGRTHQGIKIMGRCKDEPLSTKKAIGSNCS